VPLVHSEPIVEDLDGPPCVAKTPDVDGLFSVLDGLVTIGGEEMFVPALGAVPCDVEGARPVSINQLLQVGPPGFHLDVVAPSPPFEEAMASIALDGGPVAVLRKPVIPDVGR
jgi:hypothetical protein